MDWEGGEGYRRGKQLHLYKQATSISHSSRSLCCTHFFLIIILIGVHTSHKHLERGSG